MRRDAGSRVTDVDGRVRQGRRDQGEKGVQGGQSGLPAAGLQEGGRALRRDGRGRPEPESAPTSSSATATTTSTSRARRARRPTTRCWTKAVENYQKAAEKLSASDKPDDKKLGTLSLQYLVAAYGRRQAERSGQGRTGRPEDDPARAGRAVQLLRAREDLRGRRRVRGGGERCCSRPRRPSRTTPPST